MQTTPREKLNMLIVASFLVLTAGCASKQTSSEVPQQEHPAEVQAPQKAGEGAEMMGPGGMMGKMDRSQMSGMMQECMAMHKDGKMCEHQGMEKCQANMEKGECHKMMKEVKKVGKKSKSIK